MKLQQKLILWLFVLATTVYAVLGASLFNGFYRFVSEREQASLTTVAGLCARLVEGSKDERLDVRRLCAAHGGSGVGFRLYGLDGEVLSDGFPWEGSALDVQFEGSGLYALRPFQRLRAVVLPLATASGRGARLVAAMPAVNGLALLSEQKGVVAVNSVVALMFLVLLAVIFSQVVTRPLKQLHLFVVSRTKSPEALPPAFGRDEIGDLGREFCGLIDELAGKAHVERYVRTLTHELKSPITGIRSAAEILQQDLEPTDRGVFARQIEFEAGRMQMTVDRLLQLATLEGRPVSRERHPVDMGELAADVVGLVESQAKAKGIRLDLSRPDASELPVVLGDAELLRSAMLALVENALAFGPAGTVVDLSVRASSTMVVVTVTDDGPGIPAYAVDKVYDRFFSLPRPDTGQKSSGLGLSYCREIARLHGGKVRIANRLAPASGVCATLEVPTASRSQRTHATSK